MKTCYENSSLLAIWKKLPAPLCHVSRQGGGVSTCPAPTREHTPQPCEDLTRVQNVWSTEAPRLGFGPGARRCTGCLSRTAGSWTGVICRFPETVPGVLLLHVPFVGAQRKGWKRLLLWSSLWQAWSGERALSPQTQGRGQPTLCYGYFLPPRAPGSLHELGHQQHSP